MPFTKQLMARVRAMEHHSRGPAEPSTERPFISFITVSYNSFNSIEATISSVASCKSLFACEYIVIDGNSNDGTDRILDQHAQMIDVLVREADHGIYDAMNKGLRLARGEYVCFVNADDRIIPKGASKIAEKLHGSHRNVDILASAALAIKGKTETLWLPSGLDRFLVFRCPNLCHNGVYAHRSIFQKVGEFDSSLQIAADSDWIIRAVKGGARVKVVSIPTVLYSIGGMSSDIRSHANEMLLIAERTYPLLRSEVIRSLFFHLFAWHERRSLFIERPPLPLASALQEANAFYPELSYRGYLLQRLHRRLAVKAFGRLKNSVRRRDQ
ncbi:glycosyltransferase family 2 protein [Cyanobium gracile UHCC 0139]|uniref:Glycosyltransferase family 2 protein n=1 Tax=Cyanobium gracile UHCC 0139 TaxID=3110308 RepID=A0ABU5RR64_9CYAN|nr:glycosyltransferase family 2 protein [Cyanobium gracile]MEA5390275.1 glycosyltransferase family 2 protein [Cyanobium gracile UHCC 0139]